MNSVRPVSSQQARFSVPYCAAKVIYEGRPITVEDCSPESLVNEEVLKIAEKVHMSLDHELDKYHRGNQEERLSKMELILKDGRNIKKQTSSAKGWPDNPMTPSEVEEKFRILTSTVLKKEDCNRIVDLVQELDTVDDINTIMGSFIQR
jgi:2-methylcitrate dehydratase PrpD